MPEAPLSPVKSGRGWLAGLLLVSYALRVWLSLGGGAYYWPDEMRYGSTQNAAYFVATGSWGKAFVELTGHADHVFFRWAGLPVALLQHAVGGKSTLLPSLYFSLFSVGSIALLWAVARRAGASRPEALWVAFFAAASNSLFFYARHFLPYDIALFVMLCGLWLGLGPWSRRNSLLTGVVVGFGFLTYNGYWLLGGCVLVLHTLLGAGEWRRPPARAGLAFLGLLLPIGLFLGLGSLASRDLIQSYRTFAGTIKQGDFFNGYRVIAEFLWFAEGGFLIFLLLAFAYALPAFKDAQARRRLAVWAGALVFLTAGLVVLSDVVPLFMVYGRLARVLVPFLCLGAGLGTARFLERRGKARPLWSAGIVAWVLALASLNFAVPLRQVFPDGFLGLASRSIQSDTAHGYGFYRILNAGLMWGRRLDQPAPSGVEILRRRNPMQFRPYQYEGYSVEERRNLNRYDISMRLLKLPMRLSESPRWGGFPGPVRMKVTFPFGRWDLSEPLVVGGVTGRGDILFVRYVDSHHVLFGLDHWGEALVLSDPVEIDYRVPHEIVISGGLLLPPPGSDVYRADPVLGLVREQLLVVMDGKIALSRRALFHPSSQRTIYFGAALIGGSTTDPNFTGEVSGLDSAPFSLLEHTIPVLAGKELVRNRPAAWKGAMGPVRMTFTLPASGTGPNEGQPLLSVVGNTAPAVLFVVRSGPGKVKVGFDTVGSGALWSEPVAASPTGVEQAEICLGSLLPEASAAIYGNAPNFVQMRQMVYVRLNGEVALFAQARMEPVRGDQVLFGANIPASSAAAPFFRGEIESIKALGFEDIPVALNALAGPVSKLALPNWDGFPGPLQMEITFGNGLPGESQPILTTGVIGAGDFVFIRYEDGGRARICLDHWGRGLTASEPFAVEPGRTHALTLCFGALLPQASRPFYQSHPELLLLTRQARVELDGRRILDAPYESHPNRPEWITLGANFIGGSSTGSAFLGTVSKVRRAPVGEAGP